MNRYGDLSLVFLPRFSILLPTFLNISQRTVDDHASEKDRVEPGEGRLEASDQTPRYRKEKITCVVDFSRLAVPSIGKNFSTSLGRDSLRVCNTAILEVRECRALFNDTTFLLPKLVLLRVRSVPDVVHA